MEKEMATHSGILAWRIPWTEGPGGLLSMGHTETGTTGVTQKQQQQEVESLRYMCVCVCVCEGVCMFSV